MTPTSKDGPRSDDFKRDTAGTLRAMAQSNEVQREDVGDIPRKAYVTGLHRA